MGKHPDWSWKGPKTFIPHPSRRAARKAAKRARRKDRDKGNFYTSWEWLKLRYQVLMAYGAVCMCCGSTEHIVVDHIKSKRKHPELALSFDNCQVLCDYCNRGKSYQDETDWRPKLPAPELEAPQMEHLRQIMHGELL